MPGIKDKVAIIGMGYTKFGELWEKCAEDLAVEAFVEALEDAGLNPDGIDPAWFGNKFTEINLGHSVILLANALKFSFTPVSRVENVYASDTEAFKAAYYAVASGACDTALALGVEKIKDIGRGGLSRANEDILSWVLLVRPFTPTG